MTFNERITKFFHRVADLSQGPYWVARFDDPDDNRRYRFGVTNTETPAHGTVVSETGTWSEIIALRETLNAGAIRKGVLYHGRTFGKVLPKPRGTLGAERHS